MPTMPLAARFNEKILSTLVELSWGEFALKADGNNSRAKQLQQACASAFGAIKQSADKSLSFSPESLQVLDACPRLGEYVSGPLSEELQLCKELSVQVARRSGGSPEAFRQEVQRIALPERVREALMRIPNAAFSSPPAASSPTTKPFEQKAPAPGNAETIAEAFKELDAMVGFDAVREKLHQFVHLAELSRKRVALGYPPLTVSMNIALTGNPGTGKTALAKCCGKILHAAGLLTKEEPVVLGRAQLVGAHIGESEKITTEMIEKAKGGVFFADEAYALAEGGDKDFGKHVITTLLTAMDEYRGTTAFIFAGYVAEMMKFVNSNPGLDSRLSERIHLRDYEDAELAEIFVKKIKEDLFDITPEAAGAAALAFTSLRKNRGEAFGNGREAQNLKDAVVKAFATHAMLGSLLPEQLNTITLDAVRHVFFPADSGCLPAASFVLTRAGHEPMELSCSEAGLLIIEAAEQNTDLPKIEIKPLSQTEMPGFAQMN